MKLFYGNITENLVQIHEDDQQHISKVLRMREGKIFLLQMVKVQLHTESFISKEKKFYWT